MPYDPERIDERLETLRHAGLTDPVVSEVQEIAEEARRSEDHVSRCKALIILGGKYGMLGRYDESFEILGKARAVAMRHDLVDKISLVLLATANTYFFQEDHYNCLISAERAVSFQRRNKLFRHLCYSYTTISAVYMDLHDIHKAIENLHSLLEINSIHENAPEVDVLAHSNLIECYDILGDVENQVRHMRLNDELLADYPDHQKREIAIMCTHGCAYHFKTGTIEVARERFERAKAITDELDIFYLHTALIGRCWPFLLAEDRVDEAESMFRHALERVEAIDDVSYTFDVVRAMTSFYRQANRPEEFMRSYDRMLEAQRRYVVHQQKHRSHFFERMNEGSELALKNDVLTEQNEQLKVINQGLEQFARMVSHDIRAPLRNIKTMTEIVESQLDPANRDKLSRFLLVMNRSSDEILDFVESLLLFAKSGQSIEEWNDIDLNEVVAVAVNNLTGIIEERGATIQKSDLHRVRGQAYLLVSLVQNLIENGIKYNASDRVVITVSSYMKNGRRWLCIADNGVGIPKDSLSEIFSPFKRIHQVKTRGVGIGLSTCKRIVEGHNGFIEVKSEPDVGSTFSIYLPEHDVTDL